MKMKRGEGLGNDGLCRALQEEGIKEGGGGRKGRYVVKEEEDRDEGW